VSERRDGYLLIEHYGAIGDLRTVALVGRNGSIDWCPLPELDSPSVFTAILDRRRGGRFRVAPAGGADGEQRYVEDTNVLETVFRGGGGTLVLTDFMPLHGSIRGTLDWEPTPDMHRVLRCEGEEVEVEVEWAPRFDYARGRTRLSREGGDFVASWEENGARLRLRGLPDGAAEVGEDAHGPVLRARFPLRGGERLALVSQYEEDGEERRDGDSFRWLERTVEAWREWARARDPGEGGRFEPETMDRAVRSGLVLKLLTHPHTGAIAAAPTTSLPEKVGGVRNWDYRYSWVRDSAIVGQALFSLGYAAEARNFLEWVERTSCERGEQGYDLKILYGLHGETDPEEIELEHLEGYRGSRPVRVGNAAAKQFQLDIYGELLRAAYELERIEGGVVPEFWPFLRSVVEETCRRWREPDTGIWEVRSDPRHFVHSKVMAWTTLNRALELAGRCGLPAPVETWEREREKIRREILSEGFDREKNSFRRAYDGDDMDAATLLIPAVGLLEGDDPRVQGTIDRVLEELTEKGMVYRYNGEDGLPGGEGIFVLCTFWLVDALALAGRLDEAREIFDGIAERASPLGLFAEEIDPETGEFRGNFPQAFSHAGFVNSAVLLARDGKPPIRDHPTP
jgi:GH15 family glucan-1,4-alpha-glucosidase